MENSIKHGVCFFEPNHLHGMEYTKPRFPPYSSSWALIKIHNLLTVTIWTRKKNIHCMQTSRANILILIIAELNNLMHGEDKRITPMENHLLTLRENWILDNDPNKIETTTKSSAKTPNKVHNKMWCSSKWEKNDVHSLHIVSTIHHHSMLPTT